MIAKHEDSDGTGYCRDCGTTIGELHHPECNIDFCENWFTSYRNGLTREAIAKLWNRAYKTAQEIQRIEDARRHHA